ncbi:MAG: type II toxin-antitoxin system VapC family toxin [Methanomicrobiaceae archaeon]|nr:type II toxin-antitoxin system VapC family toxin [Methanomicrobiaceae archaeon]
MILLDTSFLIDYVRDSSLAGHLPEQENSAVTVISYFEILTGLQRLRSRREEQFFRLFFSEVPILDFTRAAADHAAFIGGQLARTGTMVNTLDLMIAGIAKVNHIETILTADEDFRAIAPLANLVVKGYR